MPCAAAMFATDRKPPRLDCNTLSSAVCSNTAAIAAVVEPQTMPNNSPSYNAASARLGVGGSLPWPAPTSRDNSAHRLGVKLIAPPSSSLISSVTMESNMLTNTSAGQSLPPFVPRLLRMNCSSVILFFTCALC